MKHIEDGIQVAFIQWVRMAENHDDRLKLLFHPANGGKRNPREAGRLKAAGVLAGVPDIILPVPAGGFCGLAIEFKAPKNGRATDSQLEYIDRLVKHGWLVMICTCPLAAIKTVKDYLNAEN